MHAVYDRDLAYKSDYLPLSNLLPFTLIMIGGYFFVTVCVIGRRTPFLTENGNSYDFVCFLFMIPFVFFTSTVVNWRSRHSKMCHVIG